MKTFRHILLLLQTALLFGLFTASCHDDLDTGLGSTPYEPTIGTGIVLKIPNLSQLSTRTNDEVANILDGEGTVNGGDIHLYVFNTNSSEGADKTPNVYLHLGRSDFKDAYKDLPSLDKDDDSKKEYAGAYKTDNGTETWVTVPMYPGTYKIYVVANLQSYTTLPNGKTFGTLTETELKGLTLNFPDGPITPNNLPMICLPTDIDEANASTGVFDILSKDVKTLHANLQFACAKVRYTVLFDNTTTGHSYDKFQGKYYLDVPTAHVSNIPSSSAFEQPSTTPNYTFNHIGTSTSPKVAISTHTKAEYPYDSNGNVIADYPHTTGNANDAHKVTNLKTLGSSESWINTDRRAWQAILYLPENLNEATDADGNPVGRTVITLDGKVGTDKTTQGTTDNPYTINLVAGTSDNTDHKLERGKFYDIRALAKGINLVDIDFHVEDWTARNLVYELQGPVFLNVSDTKISVESGKTTTFTYSSNVKVTYDSPIWKDKDGNVMIDTDREPIPFYDITVEDGEVKVTINSNIPASELKEINEDEDRKVEYMYFHLVAGNIWKKITVDPLSLEPFLMVDPEEIIIDVRDKVAGGDMKDCIGITVKTNCPQYYVNPEAWTALSSDSKNSSNLLYITDAHNNKIEFGSARTPKDGEEILYLWYDGLNGGHDFWTKSSHELGLTFTVDAEHDVDPDHIRILTYPSTDNYIIHMKCNWANRDPHIYVYQCLEIPGWFSKNNYAYANDPVGYSVGDGVDSKYAALEYSFTGKIAFLGWEAEKNWNALNSYGFNNKDYGFWMLGNGGSGSWDATNDDGSHYDTNFDFAADYRKTLTCAECKKTTRATWDGAGKYQSNGYWATWPGIQMTYEKAADDGKGDWYTFTLSGAAIPGKALIMFNGAHGGAVDGDPKRSYGRYPADKKVGIPLFDYPKREGWIDLTVSGTPAFVSENPEAPAPTSGIQTFRITWYKEFKVYNVNIPYDKIEFTSGPKIGTFSPDNNSSSANEKYIDIKMDVASFEKLEWRFKKDDGGYPDSRTYSSSSVNDWTWSGSQRIFNYKKTIGRD